MLEKLVSSSALALLSSSITSAVLLSSTFMLFAAYMLRNQRPNTKQTQGKTSAGGIGKSSLFTRGLRRWRERLPPGPQAWPLLGDIPTLAKMGKDYGAGALTELARRYGGIYMVRLGWPGPRMVVISDKELLKEAFVKQSHIFSDRKMSGLIEVSFPVEGSLVWQNGKPWKEHRRFMNRTLRHLGMGNSLLGQRISEECDYMCDYIDSLRGHPINPESMMICMTCNIMNAIALGKRYDFDDPRFIKLRQDCKVVLENLSNTTIYNMLTFLYHTRLCKMYREAVENVTEYIQDQVNEHKRSFNNNALRDIIDYYLREVKKGSDTKVDEVEETEVDDDEEVKGHEGDHSVHYINDQFVWRGTLDLLIAGVDSTSNHTMWTMLHMAYYPEIQKKAQAQIDEVVGRDRLPTISDRDNLPLITAIAHEVLRTSVGTTTVPHYTTEDAYLNGYFIPKGTQILGNIWGLNHDPTVFEDPYVFRPSRFLAEDGSLTGLSNVKSFGIGPRKCPGESMAHQEHFLIMAVLLHRYTLAFPEDEPIPTIEGRTHGMMLLPAKHRLRFIPR